jgi:hypothetical protein
VTTQLGIGVSINRSGFPQILVDFDKLAKETAGFSDRERSRTIQRGIDEEVLHLAALKWEAKAPENKAKLTAWGAEDDEIGKFLAKSYSGWEQLTDRQRGHEKARAVLQKRWTGRLTETARTVMRAMMEFFRGIYDKLTDTQREIIDGIEAILKGNEEAKAAGVTASAPTKKGAATAGKPTGAPLEGKTQAEAPAVGKVTPQIPPLGGKYVLPSFVTEQYTGNKRRSRPELSSGLTPCRKRLVRRRDHPTDRCPCNRRRPVVDHPFDAVGQSRAQRHGAGPGRAKNRKIRRRNQCHYSREAAKQ